MRLFLAALVVLTAIIMSAIAAVDGFGGSPPTGQQAAVVQKTAESAWGEATEGLRMRLVLEHTALTVGEPLQMKLEVQNIGDQTISLAVPQVLPVISSPGNHPYGQDHGYNVVITAESDSGRQLFIRWAQRKSVRLGTEKILLKPGDRIAVHVDTCKGVPAATRISSDEAPRAGRTSPTTVNRQSCADFAFLNTPGIYRLTGTYLLDDAQGEKRKVSSPAINLKVR